MRTGAPMSSTKISPPEPIAAASSTNCAASGMVMKKRRISGCVTVTGPPAAIWLWKRGITLPLDPSTLPNRTAMNSVAVNPVLCRARSRKLSPAARHTSSATRLVAPMTFAGRTALSELTSTKSSASPRAAASATLRVPNTLFATASNRCASIIGTCL